MESLPFAPRPCLTVAQNVSLYEDGLGLDGGTVRSLFLFQNQRKTIIVQGDLQPLLYAVARAETDAMAQRDRILLVDDSTTSLAILRRMLEGHYDLESASSGEDAIAKANGFRPDLVLLDIVMPGMDGYEVCRQLRKDPSLRNTKIVMVSSKSSIEERLEGYDAGADDYVTKPFHQDELLAKIQVYLRLKSVEELDRLKTDLLTLLAHETDTPLSAILPTLDMVMADGDMEAEERNSLLEMVRECAENLQSLFTKVLTLSSYKAGAASYSLEEEDLVFVVQSTIHELAPKLEERRIKVTESIPDSAIATLDLDSMKIVVETLLDNAVKFSPDGGEVVVNLTPTESGYDLAVIDYGAGIDPEFLPHVFEEFAVRDIDHHSSGLGLSLALARHIVLAHGGTIRASCTKETGTTFTVWLPSEGV